MKKVVIKRNRYVDSVSLMAVGDKVTKLPGITNAEAQMCTPANLEVLVDDLGYELPEVSANDLALAVTGDTEEHIEAALQMITDIIDHKNASGSAQYNAIEEIDLREDGYDLAQISLPGEYAAAEAMKALKMGLDVFIFSDNVSLEEEAELKQFGAKHGRLVMGPDCGVGLISGVALGAGSIVKDGPVGIVGASGSGCQEVACIVERRGLGVSSIIGTGGHDLLPEIGGLTMIAGMRRLEDDPKTKVIVLVSKLANLEVMGKILDIADKLSKPVVAIFLGGDEKLFEGHSVHGAFSLEEAALKAVELCTGKKPDAGYTDAQIADLVKSKVSALKPEQKYVRGLFSGGTFTEEGMIYYTQHNKGVKLNSNLKTKYAEQLSDHGTSIGHCILDLGAEDFTAEAPHPVFDPSLKLKRFKKEVADPTCAVITMDFIMGPGVAADPVTPFAKACKELKDAGSNLIFISNVCGSLEDPQDTLKAEKMLRDAGVIVTKSNYESTKIASAFLAALEERG
ncbi:MAG: hypothetical protein IJS44_00240 [Clostridia bacterium]|nr:hypothetical protein [Clostridia bacterium]